VQSGGTGVVGNKGIGQLNRRGKSHKRVDELASWSRLRALVGCRVAPASIWEATATQALQAGADLGRLLHICYDAVPRQT
jgi:hypothetical protein